METQKNKLKTMLLLIIKAEKTQEEINKVLTLIDHEESKRPHERYLIPTKEELEQDLRYERAKFANICKQYNLMRLELMDFPLGELKPEFIKN